MAKYKVTEFGEIPREWDILQLHDIFQESILKYSKTSFQTENIPILSMTRYDGLV